ARRDQSHREQRRTDVVDPELAARSTHRPMIAYFPAWDNPGRAAVSSRSNRRGRPASTAVVKLARAELEPIRPRNGGNTGLSQHGRKGNGAAQRPRKVRRAPR